MSAKAPSRPRSDPEGSGLRALIYLLSGAAALLHETVFYRLCALRLESGSGAVGTVTALMMAGLGLGSWAASRSGLGGAKALRAFLAVEVLIGFWGASSPALASGLSPLFGLLYRSLPAGGLGYEAGRTLILALVILPPAALMGATFPFILASGSAGLSVGLVYGANALGGALAALGGSLWILPSLGTTRGAWAAASLNFLAAGLAWTGLRAENPGPKPGPALPPRPSPEALALLFLTGYCGMVWELAWTRALSLCLGPTPYAFGLMLACYILGLSAGSFLAPLLPRDKLSRGLVLALMAILSVATTLVLIRLPSLPARLLAGEVLPFARHLRLVGFTALATLTPVCLGLGLCLPLWSGLASPGLLYAFNSAGSFLGAWTGAFILLPALGIRGSILALASLLAAAAAWTWFPSGLRIPAALLAAAAPALAGWFLPRPDPRDLAGGAYAYYERYDGRSPWGRARLLYYKDGPGATVSVIEDRGVPYFSVNGKIDGSLSGEDMNTQSFLAELPLALHPRPRRVLVVGLGTGVTSATALRQPGLEDLDCLEILPEVAEAQIHFRAATGDLGSDPRFHLRLGDGRAELLHGQGLYDVIISEPSNPWMGGPARLFTREFFEACRARLAPGGLASIWVQGYGLRSSTLAQIARTFRSAFPQAQFWRTGLGGSDFVLLGSSDGVPAPDLDRLGRLASSPGWLSLESGKTALSPADFLGRCVYSSGGLAGFAGSGDVVTDDLSQLEFRAIKEMSVGGTADTLELLAETSDGGLADWGPRVPAALADEIVRGRSLYRRAVRILALGRRGDPAFLDACLSLARDKEVKASSRAETFRVLADKVLTRARGLNDPDQAADKGRILEGAFALDPDRPLTRMELARAWTLQGRLDQAEALLRDSLARGIKHEAMKQAQAEIRLQRGDLSGAEALMREATAEQPAEPLVWTNLGLILSRQGREAEASACYAKALELDPEFAPARALSGGSRK